MKKLLKRLLPPLVTLLIAFFIVKRGLKWQDFQEILTHARWGWLLAAMVFQVASYGVVTSLNQMLLRHYDVRVPWRSQYLIQLAVAFIEALIPTATVSGAVLRIRLLRPYGAKADVATVVTVVEMGLITLSVILLALPVLWLAAIKHLPGVSTSPWFSASMLLLTAILLLILYKLWDRPAFRHRRRQFVFWLIHLWDAHIYPRWSLLHAWSGEHIARRLHYLSSVMWELMKDRPLAIAGLLLLRSLFEFLGLVMCFYAIGQPLPLTTMILVYTLTLAIDSLGAVPGGIGLAEVSLSALYVAFGLPTEAAVVVALSFRLTNYYLPRVAGGLSWLWLERKHPQRILEPLYDSKPTS
jgi:uncharacterized protein (TIRG00374 family)